MPSLLRFFCMRRPFMDVYRLNCCQNSKCSKNEPTKSSVVFLASASSFLPFVQISKVALLGCFACPVPILLTPSMSSHPVDFQLLVGFVFHPAIPNEGWALFFLGAHLCTIQVCVVNCLYRFLSFCAQITSCTCFFSLLAFLWPCDFHLSNINTYHYHYHYHYVYILMLYLKIYIFLGIKKTFI